MGGCVLRNLRCKRLQLSAQRPHRRPQLLRAAGGAVLGLQGANKLVGDAEAAQPLQLVVGACPAHILAPLLAQLLQSRQDVLLEQLAAPGGKGVSREPPREGRPRCPSPLVSRVRRALLISSTLDCFLSSVFSAFSFFVSYMRVPAAWRASAQAAPLPTLAALRASSSMDRISGGFMFSTFVMRPCMIRKCGLFTFSCTEWNRFCTRLGQQGRKGARAGGRRVSNILPTAAPTHAPGLGHHAVDEVLVAAADDDLPSHRDLLLVLEADGGHRTVRVVEHHRHGRLGHARLALLVHQLLQAAGAHLGPAGAAR